MKRNYEVWRIYRTAGTGHVHGEKLLKRCWTSWGAAAEIDRRENNIAVGAFVAGQVVANPHNAVIPTYECRKEGVKVF